MISRRVGDLEPVLFNLYGTKFIVRTDNRPWLRFLKNQPLASHVESSNCRSMSLKFYTDPNYQIETLVPCRGSLFPRCSYTRTNR